jgi:DNA-binding LytR/AlgR family response regulator
MLWAAVWQTLVIAVLIVGVYMTFDNARLRREIERVQQINQRLTENTSTHTVETQNFASLPSDKTTINPDTLLYIESDKNYCKITTADGTTTLRSTLTTLEKQLKPCGHVIRCHRAFLVNMKSVEGILGSASSGYKLKIKFHDATVPVSRTYIAEVLGYFEG